jgi:hypothetical protein
MHNIKSCRRNDLLGSVVLLCLAACWVQPRDPTLYRSLSLQTCQILVLCGRVLSQKLLQSCCSRGSGENDAGF